eukprot:tig00000137_g8135.t1
MRAPESVYVTATDATAAMEAFLQRQLEQAAAHQAVGGPPLAPSSKPKRTRRPPGSVGAGICKRAMRCLCCCNSGKYEPDDHDHDHDHDHDLERDHDQPFPARRDADAEQLTLAVRSAGGDQDAPDPPQLRQQA